MTHQAGLSSQARGIHQLGQRLDAGLVRRLKNSHPTGQVVDYQRLARDREDSVWPTSPRVTLAQASTVRRSILHRLEFVGLLPAIRRLNHVAPLHIAVMRITLNTKRIESFLGRRRDCIFCHGASGSGKLSEVYDLGNGLGLHSPFLTRHAPACATDLSAKFF